MSEQDEPFLKRWSRLKQRRGETDAPPRTADAASASAPSNATTDATHVPAATEPPLDLDTLPRLDDLTADTDITAFLDRRVPAALRNAALGRMWQLDPVIRDFIEMADNQWNWNVPGGAPFYGPLEPGTDIEALVAQATGATWRHWPGKGGDHNELSGQAEPVTAVTSPSVAAPQPDSAAQHEPVPEDSPAQPIAGRDRAKTFAEIEAEGIAPQGLSATAVQHGGVPPALAGLPPRRRHGSALPD